MLAICLPAANVTGSLRCTLQDKWRSKIGGDKLGEERRGGDEGGEMMSEQKRRGDGVDKGQREGSAQETHCRERDVLINMMLAMLG